MAEYFNAREILPAELIAEVLEHVPQEARSGIVIYFNEGYYAGRNAEIRRCFRIYESDPNFGSRLEIYEALSQEYGLTVRQICKLVRGEREEEWNRSRIRRRYTGTRVL